MLRSLVGSEMCIRDRLGSEDPLGVPAHMQGSVQESPSYTTYDLDPMPEGMPSFRDDSYDHEYHDCHSLGDMAGTRTTQLERTKSAPKMKRRTGHTEEGDLSRTINEEMVDLKMFLKAESRDTHCDVDSQIKNFYRDKYRKKYVASSQGANNPNQPVPEAVVAAPTPSRAESSQGVTGLYASHAAVDSALANAEQQVGAQPNVGWTPQLPDGWGKGYSYSYAKDAIPSIARGVPLPGTYGGRGGGGKKTARLVEQEAYGKNEYEARCGRQSTQNTGDWVTWGNAFVGQRETGRCGVAPARYCQGLSGAGKRGRNVAVDAAQSVRGGSVDITAARLGMNQPANEVGNPQYMRKFSQSSSRRPAVGGLSLIHI
eukprot:TRINITY_DN6899_c0_g1_i10.p1 TRINITY_DN6899_c0_g1~~TRINITY_DN6899_c0_g1_i10.p1  ORF type:complete len:393 (+),score=130.18 TRINITY_DN6899_c0_g1_i10:69-1181(+)